MNSKKIIASETISISKIEPGVDAPKPINCYFKAMKRVIIIVLLIKSFVYGSELLVHPYISIGTHQNSYGAQIEKSFTREFTKFKNSSSGTISLYALGLGAVNNIGIIGEALELNSGINLNFSYGIHSINYYLSYYLTTNSTNQTYGSLMYTLSYGNWKCGADLGNDDMYFLATDKFRTTKGSIFYRYNYLEDLYGISLDFYLWTGDLDGKVLGDESAQRRDRYYSMNGYGGDISHGILALTFSINHVDISVGWDSEVIRDNIQNRWHYFYNRPEVPLLDRKDRIYVQTTFYPKKYGY